MYTPKDRMSLEDYKPPFNYTFLLVHVVIIAIWLVSYSLSFIPGAYVSAFVLMFYILGQSIRKGLLEQLGIYTIANRYIEKAIIDVLMSLIGSITVSIILGRLFLINRIATSGVLVGVIAILDCFAALRRMRGPITTLTTTNSSFPTGKNLIIVSGFVLLAGVVFSVLRLLKFHWPYLAGTDTFSHMAAIQQILFDKGTTNIPGTYSYSYHSVVAILCTISGASPHWVMNNIFALIYPYSLVISFLFLVALTRNLPISFLAICVSMTVYEHGGLLAAYYPYPSSFSYILLFTIYAALYAITPSRKSLGIILFAYSLLVITYPGVLIASMPILVYLLVKKKYVNHYGVLVTRVLFGVILIGGLVLLLLYQFIAPSLGWILPTISIFPGVTIMSTWDLAILHYTLAYSTMSSIALFGGILLSLLLFKKPETLKGIDIDRSGLAFLSIISATYLVVFFVPLQNSFRTEMFIRPFFSTMIVVSLFVIAYSFFASTSRLQNRVQIKEYKRKKITSAIIILVTVALLIPVSYEKLRVQATYLQYGEPQNPNPEEYDLMLWIQNHTVPGDYIITDMSSGFYLRGLVFRNASTSFTIGGVAVSPYSHPNLTKKIFNFLNSTLETANSTFMSLLSDSFILSYTRTIRYILISPRTNAWIHRYRSGIISRYAPYRYEMSINDPSWTKFSSGLFNIVAESDDAKVLEIQI